MTRPSPFLTLLIALLPAACRSTAGAADKGPPASPTRVLEAWMQGSFSSADQAADDPQAYFDIRLFVTPIWVERADGPWLYVEQAAATALERPYRQRVYHLVEEPGGVRSDVYTLPGDPLELAGAWTDPERFRHLVPNDLAAREGCSIHLRRDGDAFVGSTRGLGCSSRLAGASYATSEVVIRRDRLESWDRGFDVGGAQVWGAEKGAYEFLRD